MTLIMTGKHVELTDAIREYASQKASRLPHFFDRLRNVELLADRHDSLNFEVEVIVHADHTAPFVATSVGEDLYACIDKAVSKVERQVRNHKDRRRNRKHLGSA